MSRSFASTADGIVAPSGTSAPTNIYTGSITVSVWCFPTVVGDAEHDIVCKWGSGSADQQFKIGFGAFSVIGNYSIGACIGPNFPTTGNYTAFGNSSEIVANKWYNIILLANAGNNTMTIEAVGGNFSGVGSVGISLQGTNANRSSSAQNIEIGKNASLYQFYGSIAEFGIWNAALSPGEINSLQQGVNCNLIRRDSLVGYWPLYGQASPEPDLSGNVNNGTVTNTTAANHAPVGPGNGV